MANRIVGRTASSVGMMEGAFFVSRSDLLQWVNGLLKVSLTKVEQCASGAVYCQILDSCHPGTVAMRKVNWMAKADHEFIPNYKVLQAAFDRNCIERHIAVDMLIRAKYQDNLEFLQWMKCYWDREGAGRRDYDPLQAREGKSMPPWAWAMGGTVAAVSTAGKENLRPRPAPRVEADASAKRPATARGAPVAKSASTRSLGASAAPGRGTTLKEAATSEAAVGMQDQTIKELNAKLATQQDELQDLRTTLDGLESERDYYFRKLRDIEILCATNEVKLDPALTAAQVLKDIQGILYAGNEEDSKYEVEGAEAEPLELANEECKSAGGKALEALAA